MEKLSASEIIEFLKFLAEEMPKHQEELRELDARVGDGDLGVTITLGMKGIKGGLDALESEEIGVVLARSGMNFNRAAASTFGVLFASALMRAGKAVQGKREIDLQDLAEIFVAACDGIKERGKAEIGDKTILDVMVPIAEVLKQAADEEQEFSRAIEQAHERCVQALEETASLKGKHGRAGWLKEKSVGVPDPGSVAICMMMGYLKDFVSQANKGI